MSEMPEGAQRSDDGQWWWDGDQWQAVPLGAAAGSAGSDERSMARVELGLPASRDEVTAEQFAGYVGEASCEIESGGGDDVEVLAMSVGGSEDGEALA